MKYKYGLFNADSYIKYTQQLLSNNYLTQTMKYKIGDIVKIIDINACVTAENCHAVYAKITKLGNNKYFYYLLDENKNKIEFKACSCFTDNDLELINRPIEDVREGDKIVDKHGDVREVLTVSGQMVFATYANEEYRKNPVNYTIFTIRELIGGGYTILQEPQEPETVEMTVAEVAEKLGLKGKLKIKE